jgi:hypothetical protein
MRPRSCEIDRRRSASLQIACDGNYRRLTRRPCDVGRQAPGCAAQDRRMSQFWRLRRDPGFNITAPRRTRSAHFHRPWRASYADPAIFYDPAHRADREQSHFRWLRLLLRRILAALITGLQPASA